MDGAVCRRNWCAEERAANKTAPLHEPSTTRAPVPRQNAFRPPWYLYTLLNEDTAVSLGKPRHPRLPLLEGQAAREVRRYSEYSAARERRCCDALDDRCVCCGGAARRRSHRMVLRCTRLQMMHKLTLAN